MESITTYLSLTSDITELTDSFEHNPKNISEPFKEIVGKIKYKNELRSFNNLKARERVLIEQISINTIKGDIEDETRSLVYMMILKNIKKAKGSQYFLGLDEILLISQSLDKNIFTALRLIWNYQNIHGNTHVKEITKDRYIPELWLQKSINLGLIISVDSESKNSQTGNIYQLTNKGFKIMTLDVSAEMGSLNKALSQIMMLKSHNLTYVLDFNYLDKNNWIAKHLGEYKDTHETVVELFRYSDLKTQSFISSENKYMAFMEVIETIKIKIVNIFEKEKLNEVFVLYLLEFKKEEIGIDQMWISLKGALKLVEDTIEQSKKPFLNYIDTKQVAKEINDLFNDFMIFHSHHLKMENREDDWYYKIGKNK